jgi:hypothetical protein
MRIETKASGKRGGRASAVAVVNHRSPIGKATMNQAMSRGFGRLGPVVLAALAMYACIGKTERAAADDTGAPVRFDDPDAKALALRMHAEVRAMDKLPQFSYRVESGNGDVETMLEMGECTLPWLKQALDEPVSKERWF